MIKDITYVSIPSLKSLPKEEIETYKKYIEGPWNYDQKIFNPIKFSKYHNLKVPWMSLMTASAYSYTSRSVYSLDCINLFIWIE
jgi:hypothetical protein